MVKDHLTCGWQLTLPTHGTLGRLLPLLSEAPCNLSLNPGPHPCYSSWPTLGPEDTVMEVSGIVTAWLARACCLGRVADDTLSLSLLHPWQRFTSESRLKFSPKYNLSWLGSRELLSSPHLLKQQLGMLVLLFANRWLSFTKHLPGLAGWHGR